MHMVGIAPAAGGTLANRGKAMKAADAAAFAKAMDRLFSIYGSPITNAMREAWWGSLLDFSLGHVMEGMSMHAADPDGGRFVPTPAHVIRKMEEAVEKRQQLAADIRSQFAGEIHAIEDRLYRAQHDMQLERIDKAAATVIISDCHRRLREVNATMRDRLRQGGHHADAYPHHSQRVIGA